MKKTFKVKNLDCANCAAKMEEKIKKIAGVDSAKLSFLTERLTIEASENSFDGILAEAKKVCKKIEPDCEIIEG